MQTVKENKKYVLWNAGICPIASKVGHVTLVSSLKNLIFEHLDPLGCRFSISV